MMIDQAAGSNSIVNVSSLRRTFVDEAGAFDVLKDISFSVEQGEMIALIGESGAGKTTLLQILGGLDRCSDGSIHVGGQDLNRMNARQLSRFRSEFIGFVFQFHHLLPDFTAVENVCVPGMILGKKKPQCLPRARELLAAMGLERQIHHYPAELSGGERQRVALARALFNEPALVLADEPTGNLDSRNSEQLLALFNKANRELRQTFIVATHNEHLTGGMRRVVRIRDGVVVNE
jgi:lipoprotein-releasing system ATP-binding protein